MKFLTPYMVDHPAITWQRYYFIVVDGKTIHVLSIFSNPPPPFHKMLENPSEVFFFDRKHYADIYVDMGGVFTQQRFGNKGYIIHYYHTTSAVLPATVKDYIYPPAAPQVVGLAPPSVDLTPVMATLNQIENKDLPDIVKVLAKHDDKLVLHDKEVKEAVAQSATNSQNQLKNFIENIYTPNYAALLQKIHDTEQKINDKIDQFIKAVPQAQSPATINPQLIAYLEQVLSDVKDALRNLPAKNVQAIEDAITRKVVPIDEKHVKQVEILAGAYRKLKAELEKKPDDQALLRQRAEIDQQIKEKVEEIRLAITQNTPTSAPQAVDYRPVIEDLKNAVEGLSQSYAKRVELLEKAVLTIDRMDENHLKELKGLNELYDTLKKQMVELLGQKKAEQPTLSIEELKESSQLDNELSSVANDLENAQNRVDALVDRLSGNLNSPKPPFLSSDIKRELQSMLEDVIGIIPTSPIYKNIIQELNDIAQLARKSLPTQEDLDIVRNLAAAAEELREKTSETMELIARVREESITEPLKQAALFKIEQQFDTDEIRNTISFGEYASALNRDDGSHFSHKPGGELTRTSDNRCSFTPGSLYDDWLRDIVALNPPSDGFYQLYKIRVVSIVNQVIEVIRGKNPAHVEGIVHQIRQIEWNAQQLLSNKQYLFNNNNRWSKERTILEFYAAVFEYSWWNSWGSLIDKWFSQAEKPQTAVQFPTSTTEMRVERLTLSDLLETTRYVDNLKALFVNERDDISRLDWMDPDSVMDFLDRKHGRPKPRWRRVDIASMVLSINGYLKDIYHAKGFHYNAMLTYTSHTKETSTITRGCYNGLVTESKRKIEGMRIMTQTPNFVDLLGLILTDQTLGELVIHFLMTEREILLKALERRSDIVIISLFLVLMDEFILGIQSNIMDFLKGGSIKLAKIEDIEKRTLSYAHLHVLDDLIEKYDVPNTVYVGIRNAEDQSRMSFSHLMAIFDMLTISDTYYKKRVYNWWLENRGTKWSSEKRREKPKLDPSKRLPTPPHAPTLLRKPTEKMEKRKESSKN